jgi:hypothetical protein
VTGEGEGVLETDDEVVDEEWWLDDREDEVECRVATGTGDMA